MDFTGLHTKFWFGILYAKILTTPEKIIINWSSLFKLESKKKFLLVAFSCDWPEEFYTTFLVLTTENHSQNSDTYFRCLAGLCRRNLGLDHILTPTKLLARSTRTFELNFRLSVQNYRGLLLLLEIETPQRLKQSIKIFWSNPWRGILLTLSRLPALFF